MDDSEIQQAIDDNWHLEGRVMVLQRIGKYFISRPETFADREDLVHAGPWNVNLAWIQFGYERVFKFCYKCGCIGHQEHRCPYYFEEATDMIHRRIHAARPDPESNFLVTPQLDLYSKAIKAYTNSNRNCTTTIEILWAEDEAADEVFEVVNMDGSRMVFFVRHAGLAMDGGDNDPSSADDPTEPLTDDDQEDNHASNRSVNEPHNASLEGHDEGNLGNASSDELQLDKELWDSEQNREDPSRFGLDDSFGVALQAMGLTSIEDNVELTRKRTRLDMGEPSRKQARNFVDLNVD